MERRLIYTINSKIGVNYRAVFKHRNSQIDKTKGKSIEQLINKARLKT